MLTPRLSTHLISLALAVNFQAVSAENHFVTGMVADTSGRPIPYAELFVPGEGTGTTSDRHGRFVISVPIGQETVLRVRHSAYEPMDITVGQDSDFVNIRLELKVYRFRPVTVEGNLYAKEKLSLPVSHHLVPIDESPNSGNSVGDKLDRFGIQVKDYGGAAGLKTIASPTGYGEHVLVMLESLPLNSPQNGGFDFSFLPADLLSHGEFYWGQGSSLYGANAMGGTLNLIVNQDQASYLRIKSGSFGEKGLNGKVALKFNSVRWALYAGHYENQGSFRENNDFRQRSYGTHVSLPMGRLWTAQYFSFGGYIERGISGSVQFPSPQARKANNDWIHIASVRGVSRFGQSELQLGITNSNEKFTNPEWFVDSRHKINTWRWKTIHRFPERGGLQNTVTLEFAQNHVNSDDAGNHQELLMAGGLLTQIHPYSNVFLFPSLRIDKNQNRNTTVSTGGLAILWRDESAALKSISLNAGTSYRDPTFNDLYWEDPSGFSSGNSSLKAEKGSSIDLFLELWPFGWRAIRINLRGYHFFTQNLIQWVPDENWIYSPENLSKTESFGTSLIVDASPPRLPFKIEIGTEQNRSRLLSEGATRGMRLLYVPAVSHWGEVTYRTGFFDIRCSYRFLGKRRYSYIEPGSLSKPYARLDVSVRFHGPTAFGFVPIIDVGARNVENQQNQQSVHGYPESGRVLFLRVTFEFD